MQTNTLSEIELLEIELFYLLTTYKQMKLPTNNVCKEMTDVKLW